MDFKSITNFLEEGTGIFQVYSEYQQMGVGTKHPKMTWHFRWVLWLSDIPDNIREETKKIYENIELMEEAIQIVRNIRFDCNSINYNIKTKREWSNRIARIWWNGSQEHTFFVKKSFKFSRSHEKIR